MGTKAGPRRRSSGCFSGPSGSGERQWGQGTHGAQGLRVLLESALNAVRGWGTHTAQPLPSPFSQAVDRSLESPFSLFGQTFFQLSGGFIGIGKASVSSHSLQASGSRGCPSVTGGRLLLAQRFCPGAARSGRAWHAAFAAIAASLFVLFRI